MPALLLLTALTAADPPPAVVRRVTPAPIISPAMLPGRDGHNLNGPSLIRAPDWLPQRLGRYYLYFAHHSGRYIRLATADQLSGPWTIYQPGTLRLDQVPSCQGHLASPDVHIDHARRELRMYFHGPAKAGGGQLSYVARSVDGLHWAALPAALGTFYFRAFPYQEQWFALAKGGLLYRSPDGLQPFEESHAVLPDRTQPSPSGNTPGPRHVAVHRRNELLDVYYSNIGDAPERILRRTVPLTDDWQTWQAGPLVEVLRPETVAEGVDLPVTPSIAGAATGREHALRDPAIFVDVDQRVYLLYSVAGESGIGLAEVLG
ncbi:MAG: hypothetical protein IT204_20945 [Fimbriimonadaceae bacterium]|nr:hypothetical protein [Fimbriimonadaceae bacterium]